MIKKIALIKNFAVFKDFKWDDSVKDNNGNILDFKKINIIYGRNYSGKTTLSRIMRSLEKKVLPNNYNKPQFKVIFEDESEINETTLNNNKTPIRVFNDDFIRENLAFISDPEKDIEPFAILGDDNAQIEKEITKINDELGNNEEGKEKTGLYKKEEDCTKTFCEIEQSYSRAKNNLYKQLTEKATANHTIAIKYNSLYGDPNYNITKLHADINLVLKKDYQPLSESEKNTLILLLKENKKGTIYEFEPINSCISNIINTTHQLLERKIGESEKIEELVHNAILNKWVEDGKKIHKELGRKTCAFCGGEISQSRWDALEKHFDREWEILKENINNLMIKIETESNYIDKLFSLDLDSIYSTYIQEFENLKVEYSKFHDDTIEPTLSSLKEQLEDRRKEPFKMKDFITVKDYTSEINDFHKKFNNLIKKSNKYSDKLGSYQKQAKDKLRLFEVFEYITTIKYQKAKDDINVKMEFFETAKNEKKQIETEIEQKKQLIEQKRLLQNDEQKGAEKVNSYLNDYFGNHYLSLKVEKDNEEGKSFRFEVVRDNKKAYHLSEGECSLVAFCYFMAKLEDISTNGTKPIIWIDDPITSLDSNHIFFIYSLINEKIVGEEKYQQIFISTHNLSFLKYLKRLPNATNEIMHDNINEHKRNFRHLIIQRLDNNSELSMMPIYLKKYITEFNYLFKQIYDCATINKITDTNYTVFYNFGNNARKFLELYLYYKYPDDEKDRDKYLHFFGEEDKIPSILIERVNNEYSHLSSSFERGETPTETPEMQIAAKYIITKIKEKDKEQYEALLKSINEQ